MDALEVEYGPDDAGIERFTSSSFNKFIMVDSKSINEQIHVSNPKETFSMIIIKYHILLINSFHLGQTLLETFVISKRT